MSVASAVSSPTEHYTIEQIAAMKVDATPLAKDLAACIAWELDIDPSHIAVQDVKIPMGSRSASGTEVYVSEAVSRRDSLWGMHFTTRFGYGGSSHGDEPGHQRVLGSVGGLLKDLENREIGNLRRSGEDGMSFDRALLASRKREYSYTPQQSRITERLAALLGVSPDDLIVDMGSKYNPARDDFDPVARLGVSTKYHADTPMYKIAGALREAAGLECRRCGMMPEVLVDNCPDLDTLEQRLKLNSAQLIVAENQSATPQATAVRAHIAARLGLNAEKDLVVREATAQVTTGKRTHAMPQVEIVFSQEVLQAKPLDTLRPALSSMGLICADLDAPGAVKITGVFGLQQMQEKLGLIPGISK